MAVKIQCDECEATLRVQEESVGRKVRCPSCRSVFVARESVETGGGSRSRPAGVTAVRRPERPAPVEDDDEDQDEGREEEPRPRRSSLSVRLGARGDDGGRKARDDDEDDEDDEAPSERPLKKKKKKKKKGRSKEDQLRIALIGGGAFLGLAAIVAVVFLILPKVGAKKHPAIDETAWKKFTPQEGGYEILIPGDPVRQVQPIPGSTAQFVIYLLEMKTPDCGFAVGRIRIPPQEVGRLTNEQRFEGAREGMLANMKGAKFVGQKDMKVEDYPAREYVVDVEDGKLVAWLVIAKQDLYILMSGGKRFESDHPGVRKFLGSFKLTDKKK